MLIILDRKKIVRMLMVSHTKKQMAVSIPFHITNNKMANFENILTVRFINNVVTMNPKLEKTVNSMKEFGKKSLKFVQDNAKYVILLTSGIAGAYISDKILPKAYGVDVTYPH